MPIDEKINKEELKQSIVSKIPENSVSARIKAGEQFDNLMCYKKAPEWMNSFPKLEFLELLDSYNKFPDYPSLSHNTVETIANSFNSGLIADDNDKIKLLEIYNDELFKERFLYKGIKRFDIGKLAESMIVTNLAGEDVSRRFLYLLNNKHAGYKNKHHHEIMQGLFSLILSESHYDDEINTDPLNRNIDDKVSKRIPLISEYIDILNGSGDLSEDKYLARYINCLRRDAEKSAEGSASPDFSKISRLNMIVNTEIRGDGRNYIDNFKLVMLLNELGGECHEQLKKLHNCGLISKVYEGWASRKNLPFMYVDGEELVSMRYEDWASRVSSGLETSDAEWINSVANGCSGFAR